MKPYLLSIAVALGVGVLCALLRVKSPAPPLVVLVGLLGMVIGEGAMGPLREHIGIEDHRWAATFGRHHFVTDTYWRLQNAASRGA